MITLNFTKNINESEQEVGSTKPILEIEEVPCLLDRCSVINDETKKYF
ncbi:Uncharacterised protein [uncultured archaeon]|nr:Uncharacterised protein [uncultured archaeon]